MNKIKLSKISKKCNTQKGFNNKGCFGCSCKDLCCFDANVDFDKESYELFMKYKALIEPIIKKPIEACFEKGWYNESDYLGGNMKGAINNKDGYCIFHNEGGKGCILFNIVLENKLSQRMIPSICRLFPLSWMDGELVVYDEDGEDIIPPECNCMDPKNKTKKTVLDTQKKAVEDIFEINSK